ncbi:IS5 family transposase [Trichonephila inaurata madagascariensis]|uniref:IS5 family transposase n=1 Tax=Trichonephila inaurata madagascariensis TaxID=2747483 RepID=A0A8X7CU97_9ARAC|nr:IS5 family transposase [Trichonephila inaurata madagascariensis]
MYPSDISDKEWKTIEPYFEPKKTGRPRKHSIRTIINAIRYMMRTGCQWRQLPKDFPPWKTVYSCNSRLKKSGIWQEIHDFLVKKYCGLVIAAEVHSASIQDRDSALNLFAQAKCKVPTLRKFFADQGYIGKLQNRCLLETGCLLTIAKKIVDTGFKLFPNVDLKNFCLAFQF